MSEGHDRRGGPGGSEGDYEARFAEIVAHWHQPEGREVDADGFDADGDDTDPGSSEHDALRPDASSARRVFGTGVAADTGWRVHVPPDDENDEGDEYRPPLPAPLPRGDLTFWGALVGLVSGPLWLVYLVVAHPHGSRVPMTLAVLVTLAGFFLLVSRLPKRRAVDDEGDDGAVL